MTCMMHCCGSSPELPFTRACRPTPHIIAPPIIWPELDGNSGVVGLQCVRNLPEK